MSDNLKNASAIAPSYTYINVPTQTYETYIMQGYNGLIFMVPNIDPDDGTIIYDDQNQQTSFTGYAYGIIPKFYYEESTALQGAIIRWKNTF